MPRHPQPLALSLSKGCPFLPCEKERQGFDKLSLSGTRLDEVEA